LELYYNAIRTTAHQIGTHTEKQTFLKVIYEGFYKVYNKKAADRLGVVYTPNEIVRFMIESADWLCQKHFSKALIDKGVEILDPATGTGSFICELMEHFRGQKQKLAWKYKEELHANEVAILPYYVANLNIEATYAAITGQYAEFPNLCFVDTLDNVAALGKFSGHQEDMFGSVSEENVARIKRQNQRKISVIIGNPPYNANQLNENENNKNREYPEIDRRIKATYIKASTAQKTKLYDMYARFFRWASDRIPENGIVAFVSNSSFLDDRTYDGFRKLVANDFSEIRIIDLKGNARTSGERRRMEGGNVFEDQIRVGIAIYFCVRDQKAHGCRILYQAVPDYAKSEDKRSFLQTPLADREFDVNRPDPNSNWINLADTNSDFESLLALGNKITKETKRADEESSIFKLFSLGIVTNRDEWVIGATPEEVTKKSQFFIETYNRERARLKNKLREKNLDDFLDTSIKWTRAVKRDFKRNVKFDLRAGVAVKCMYRPFTSRWLYYDRRLIEMLNQTHVFFGPATGENIGIVFRSGKRADFAAIATTQLPAVDMFTPSAGQVIARWRYVNGVKVDNITDWAMIQFRARYDKGKKPNRPITKDAIFHYVYGVFHDPIYREKYLQNLKREFPRIPLYADFWKWAEWGGKLMALHIGYETVKPWKLERVDVPDKKSKNANLPPKPSLKADRGNGVIVLDSETQLTRIPPEAWSYKLGNRSALEWILDQYKEKKLKDPTIRTKFNTYRFADHKEKVVDLLMRVTRVSVETMEIVKAMNSEKR